jgi:hypothetical protein
MWWYLKMREENSGMAMGEREREIERREERERLRANKLLQRNIK